MEVPFNLEGGGFSTGRTSAVAKVTTTSSAPAASLTTKSQFTDLSGWEKMTCACQQFESAHPLVSYLAVCVF